MSQNHSLNHEITVSASIEKVLQALTTADGLKSWNTHSVEGDGQVGTDWNLTYGNITTFTWHIDLVSPTKVVWTCTKGPGDSVGTKTEFNLQSKTDSRTLIEFKHHGWSHSEGNFRKCNTLWGALLHHLAAYVETGKSNPTYN